MRRKSYKHACEHVLSEVKALEISLQNGRYAIACLGGSEQSRLKWSIFFARTARKVCCLRDLGCILFVVWVCWQGARLAELSICGECCCIHQHDDMFKEPWHRLYSGKQSTVVRGRRRRPNPRQQSRCHIRRRPQFASQPQVLSQRRTDHAPMFVPVHTDMHI